MRARLLIATACLLAASCVTGGYGTVRTYQPPRIGSYGDLVVGVTNVDQAIATLGAPLDVIEIGRGLALTWGWQEARGWNVAVSAPIGDVNGSVSYANNKKQFPGIVLFFDEDWRLVLKRKGFLANLVPTRRPPRDVDDDLSKDDLSEDGQAP